MLLAAELEQLAVAGGVEGEDRAAVLKPLRPLGPAAAGVLAFDGEDRRAAGRVPCLLDQADLLRGELEEAGEGLGQVGRLESSVSICMFQ